TQVHGEVVERPVVPHDDAGAAAGDTDSGVGRARRRGAGREAVADGVVPLDDGSRGTAHIPNAVSAVVARHVFGDVVVTCRRPRDLNPPLVAHQPVVAHDVAERTARDLDAAGVRGEVVDRDVVLDPVVVGSKHLDAVVVGGGRDVLADCVRTAARSQPDARLVI